MKKTHLSSFFFIFNLGVFLFVSVANAKTEGDLSPGLVNPGYNEHPSWFKVSFLDLFDDIDEATKNNKRLMIYYYQDGCPYCKKFLEDSFGQKAIVEKTQKYFDVVAINLWGDNNVTVGDKSYTEKAFAESLKVQYTPTLLFFDENKKIVFRANGYYPPEKFSALLDYIGQKQESTLTYQAYMAATKPQPASGKLHDDINTLAADNLQHALSDNKPLLVMFEQNDCNACDELHMDILKRKESIELLSHFNVVVLNMWSEKEITTPSGSKLPVSGWAEQLDIKYAPSLVFFDKTGAEVFRADAYLKAFHTQSIMDYIASGAYKTQSNFQRYIDTRADHLRELGIKVNLMD